MQREIGELAYNDYYFVVHFLAEQLRGTWIFTAGSRIDDSSLLW